jgi:hypothetical protein
MRVFLDFIAENQSAMALVDSVSKYEGHQGSVIRFSDFFYEFVDTALNDPDMFADICRHSYGPYGVHRRADCFHGPKKGPLSVVTYSDALGYLAKITNFSGNDELLRRWRHFRPFEVTISIYNDAESEPFQKMASEFANDNTFNVVIERRSRCEILAGSREVHRTVVGGISIGRNTGNYGTLGGILHRDDGKIYGLTCSHVLGGGSQEKVYQPSLRDDAKNSAVIGEVERVSQFVWSSTDSPCSPRIGLDKVNSMDAALFRLSETLPHDFSIHNLGNVTGVKPFDAIVQGMDVEFNGRTTDKRKRLAVGGLCVSYKVGFKQQSACFTNLIELRDPAATQILGYGVQTPPVKKGDSGAWICSSDQAGYNWCGMLVAGDLDRGYFVAADDINRYLEEDGHTYTTA